jgi:hypothetical protein
LVTQWGIESCGVISTILADGWLQFLYDKLEAEDSCGDYDVDFWKAHMADPCAKLSCALLTLYAENVPEARFQWAKLLLPILEQLVALKARKQTSFTTELVDLDIRATIFRVAASMRVLAHLGFEIETMYAVYYMSYK